MKTRLLKVCNLIVILCISPIASAMQPEDLKPRLMNAIKAQNIAEVQALLAAGVDPNFVVPGNFGEATPLIAAVMHYNPELVKLLLAYRADPNGIDPMTGNNALLSILTITKAIPVGIHYDPSQNIKAIIDMLIPITNLTHENNQKDSAFRNILIKPAYENFLNSVLASPTNDINSAVDSGGNTALIMAVQMLDNRHSYQIVKHLLTIPGIDINKTNSNGYTALDIAQNRTGKARIVKMLRDAGAVSGSSQPRKAEKPQPQRAHPYSQPGAMPGFRSGPQQMPSAGAYGPMPEAPFYGPASSVPPQAPSFGKPAPRKPKSLEKQLFDAVKLGDPLAVNRLLQEGANPNALVPQTPLMEAARLGNLSIVQILLNNAKTNPNTQNQLQDSALNLAIMWGKVDIINILVNDARTAINLLNNGRRTPLDEVLYTVFLNPEQKKVLMQLFRTKGARTSAELYAQSQSSSSQAAPPPMKIKRPVYAPTTYALLEVPNNATAYEILHIEPTASDEEVKKAWRQLSLQWHPDKNPAIKEDATEVFKLLETAIKEIEIERKRKIK